MRALRPVAAAVALACVAAGVPACADLWGFQPLSGSDASTSGDAAPDAPDAGPPCDSKRWPARPASDDPGGNPDAGGENGFYWVIDRLNVFANPDGTAATFGYDLDGVCTNSVAQSSCKLLQTLPADSTNVNDLPGGADSNTVRLVQVFTRGAFLNDMALNDILKDGRGSIMLRLKGYKGIANQRGEMNPQMFFGALTLLGTVGSVKPNFDGQDQWIVSADEVGPFYQFPAKEAARVWVADDTLVAEYDGRASLWINVTVQGATDLEGRLRVDLESPTVVAKLIPRAGDGGAPSYDLEGTLVGRWRASDVLEQFFSLRVDGMPICQYKLGGVFPVSSELIRAICDGRDIALPGNDGTCDAVSVAIAFHASPARWGGAMAPPPPNPNGCVVPACAGDAGAD